MCIRDSSIGTPATRAAIVVGLVNHGYLEDDGKRVISTPKAREFYRILPDEVKKADMTAYWWVMQEDVRTGKDDYHILTNSVLETVRTIVHTKYPMLSEELRSQLAAASGRDRYSAYAPAVEALSLKANGVSAALAISKAASSLSGRHRKLR